MTARMTMTATTSLVLRTRARRRSRSARRPLPSSLTTPYPASLRFASGPPVGYPAVPRSLLTTFTIDPSLMW
jgi:hypothetical protein